MPRNVCRQYKIKRLSAQNSDEKDSIKSYEIATDCTVVKRTTPTDIIWTTGWLCRKSSSLVRSLTPTLYQHSPL